MGRKDQLSVRFTRDESKMLKQLADEENERKVSSLLRRIIIGHLKERQQLIKARNEI